MTIVVIVGVTEELVMGRLDFVLRLDLIIRGLLPRVLLTRTIRFLLQLVQVQQISRGVPEQRFLFLGLFGTASEQLEGADERRQFEDFRFQLRSGKNSGRDTHMSGPDDDGRGGHDWTDINEPD